MSSARDDRGAALEPAGRVSDGAKATGIVAAGMMTMNVFAYAFSLLCARLLGPSDFGAVSALLGVMIVANVGALALQATAARRLATTAPDHRDAVTRDVLRNGWRVAVALGILLLALSPVLHRLLHLDSWIAACAPALVCVSLTLMGAYAGILQGKRRWAALSTVYAAMGTGRILVGGIAVAINPSVASAMSGVAVGAMIPAVVGAAYCHLPAPGGGEHQPVARELWRNGHILLALFAFTNVDVLLARHLLDQHDAGIYAAGTILAKACLFLPTFVLVAAFPDMARDRTGRPWLRPLLAVSGLGAVAIVGARVLPDLAVAFAGGSEYAEVGDVAWLFAVEGTLFACLQILVYDTIASQTHAGFVLWLGAAVVVVVALVALDSVPAIVATVALVAAGVALVTGLMPAATDPD